MCMSCSADVLAVSTAVRSMLHTMNVVIQKEAAMKYGMRKPSWKKSLSARTKGRATRAVKKALIPGYGKKGMGWLHTKRKLYNTVYKKTTFSLFDLFK